MANPNPSSTAPQDGSSTGGLFSGAPKLTFGFNSSSTGGPSAGASSIFRSSSTPGTGLAAPGSLFATQPSTTSAAPSNTSAPTFSGLFGSSSTGTNFFGGLPSTSETPAHSSAPPAGGLFGTPATTQPGLSSTGPSSILGAKPDASTGMTAKSSIFGQTAIPGTQAPSAGGLFTLSAKPSFSGLSAQSTAQATPEKPVSPLPSTTPAGAPPLGAPKTQSSGLFANLSTAPSTLFGNTPSASSTPASQNTVSNAPTSSIFGNKPGGAPPSSLFAGQPAQNTTSMQPPSSAAPSATSTPSALFGAKPSIPATSAGSTVTPVAPSTLFASSNPTPTTLAATATSSAAPAAAAKPSLFSSGLSTTPQTTSVPASTTAPSSLFGKPVSAPTSTTPAPSLFSGTATATTNSAPTQPGSLFASTSAPASASTTAQTTSASSTSAGDIAGATLGKPAPGLFGNKPSGDTKSTTTSQPAGPSQNTASSTTTLGASTSGPASHIPRLKNKSMDDIITRWASDLSKYQKEFKDQATEVARWDSMLVDNGDKIQKLYLNTYEAERASHEIERQLLSVESQQDELELWLDRYEAEAQDMFARQMGHADQLAGPDQERERTYKLAERLTQHLEEKTKNLSQMVQEINELSGTLSKGNRAEDPLSQIVRVLNSHLAQLQWIDANSLALHAKVAAAQKASGNLGSHNYGGSDNDASESFYRSYLGRR